MAQNCQLVLILAAKSGLIIVIVWFQKNLLHFILLLNCPISDSDKSVHSVRFLELLG